MMTIHLNLLRKHSTLERERVYLYYFLDSLFSSVRDFFFSKFRTSEDVKIPLFPRRLSVLFRGVTFFKHAARMVLIMFSRTMKQSNWTESRRVWTKSTPTCARPRKISLEWKSAAVSAFFHATSRAVPNRFTLFLLLDPFKSNLFFAAHRVKKKKEKTKETKAKDKILPKRSSFF